MSSNHVNIYGSTTTAVSKSVVDAAIARRVVTTTVVRFATVPKFANDEPVEWLPTTWDNTVSFFNFIELLNKSDHFLKIIQRDMGCGCN